MYWKKNESEYVTILKIHLDKNNELTSMVDKLKLVYEMKLKNRRLHTSHPC